MWAGPWTILFNIVPGPRLLNGAALYHYSCTCVLEGRGGSVPRRERGPPGVTLGRRPCPWGGGGPGGGGPLGGVGTTVK